MRITFLTLFPEMYNDFLNTSIIKRIIDKGIVKVEFRNIRDYSQNKHKHVDDTPYGGGAGMLMSVDVLKRTLDDAKNEDSYVLLTSPKATPFTQSDARRLALKKDIVIVCGHYEGIDYRFEKFVDEKVSIGDYVLTGGELPSMVIADCIMRLINESISKASLNEETFDNQLLEYPQYTRPYDYNGDKVPEVLTSGNHKLIQRHNLKMALLETVKYRPDLLKNRDWTKEEVEILEELVNETKRRN